jgi:phage-related protein
MSSTPIKPVHWVGASYKDFRSFPDLVQDVMGFALYQAQIGRMHGSAKPLKGFGGASVVEIVDDHQGDTYRAVYTVKFESAIYVLHAFQKKSKQGIKTPQAEIELVKRRLKAAEEDHKARSGAGNG